MKSVKSLKLIIFILLSVLIAVFAGCAGTALSPDEIKITNAIYGYFQAISDQDWDGARSYCVYESTAYNDVNDIEELWYPDSEETEEIDIEFIVEDIDAIIVTGEYAEVQMNPLSPLSFPPSSMSFPRKREFIFFCHCER